MDRNMLLWHGHVDKMEYERVVKRLDLKSKFEIAYTHSCLQLLLKLYLKLNYLSVPLHGSKAPTPCMYAVVCGSVDANVLVVARCDHRKLRMD